MRNGKPMIFLVSAAFLVGIVILTVFFRPGQERTERLSNTLNELYPDENWSVGGQMAVERFLQTFRDPNGNEIQFYTCQAREMTGQVSDEEFYGCVVNLLEMETSEARQVGAYNAILYVGGGRAYLCWRPEETVALILEYDPLAVSEADMLRMAESAEDETDADQ